MEPTLSLSEVRKEISQRWGSMTKDEKIGYSGPIKMLKSNGFKSDSKIIDKIKNTIERCGDVNIEQENELLVENLCPTRENTKDEGSSPTKVSKIFKYNLKCSMEASIQ